MIDVLQIDNAKSREKQLSRLQEIKDTRDESLVQEALEKLTASAHLTTSTSKGDDPNNLMKLAIDAADRGDYSVIEELYELLKKPYSEQPEMEKWFTKRPEWARHKVGCSMLSCSS